MDNFGSFVVDEVLLESNESGLDDHVPKQMMDLEPLPVDYVDLLLGTNFEHLSQVLRSAILLQHDTLQDEEVALRLQGSLNHDLSSVNLVPKRDALGLHL